MTWLFALLAVWLWCCLVFAERPGQLAIFGPFVIVLAVLSSAIEKLCDAVMEVVNCTGRW